MAVRLEVLHPVNARVRAARKGTLSGCPSATVTACGCSRPRRGSNSNPPVDPQVHEKQQRLGAAEQFFQPQRVGRVADVGALVQDRAIR